MNDVWQNNKITEKCPVIYDYFEINYRGIFDKLISQISLLVRIVDGAIYDLHSAK